MISRREALATIAATPAISKAMPRNETAPIKKPKALKPGDTVALICPAGAADGQEHLDKCVAKMAALGLKSIIGPNALKRHGYLGGTDCERAADLNWAIGNPEVQGIVAVRGGYGCMRILEALDYDTMRKHPKVLLGYSDITALHMAFLRKSGVVSFHGPCGESSWNEFATRAFKAVVMEGHEGVELTGGPAFVPGKARGRLIGGNLSLVAALVGTPFGPQLDGAILFLEDIGEDPYRVDRMLTSLLLTGHLEKCAGIVFGNFRDRKPPAGAETEPVDPGKTFTLEQVLMDRCQAAGVPAATGFKFGHVADNHVMPLGVRAELEALKNGSRLRFLESAVN